MSYDKTKDTQKADVKKEVGEAVDAIVDYAVDGAKRAYYKLAKRVGYQLTDPTVGVNDAPVTAAGTEMVKTAWVDEQVEAGLIVPTEAPK